MVWLLALRARRSASWIWHTPDTPSAGTSGPRAWRDHDRPRPVHVWSLAFSAGLAPTGERWHGCVGLCLGVEFPSAALRGARAVIRDERQNYTWTVRCDCVQRGVDGRHGTSGDVFWQCSMLCVREAGWAGSSGITVELRAWVDSMFRRPRAAASTMEQSLCL